MNVAALAVALLAPSLLSAQSAGSEWRAEARAAGLSAPQLEHLAKRGFVVAGPPLRQVFAPHGLHTKSEALARLFRATRWLQTVPLRASRDVELLAWLQLGSAAYRLAGEPRSRPLVETWIRGKPHASGSPTDLDIEPTWDFVQSWNEGQTLEMAEHLAKWRRSLKAWAHELPSPRIEDQLRNLRNTSPTESLRVFAASWTADTAAFAGLASSPEERVPLGQVALAALGAPFARNLLPSGLKSRVQSIELRAELPSDPGLNPPGLLYRLHLDCLRALCAEADKGAPPLFHSDSWRRLRLGSALASWARLRRATQLSQKQSMRYTSLEPEAPAAFVEPVPEFFGRVATLATRWQHKLARHALLPANATPRQRLARRLTRLAELCRQAEGYEELRKLAGAELLWSNGFVQGMFSSLRLCERLSQHSTPTQWRDFADTAERRARLLRHDAAAALRESEDWMLCYLTPSLQDLWRDAERLARQLESLAHRQLRGLPFGAREEALILGLGERLAAMHLYSNSDKRHPRDDATSLVALQRNPARGTTRYGAAGRPRRLYVLYRWRETRVLCVGAVTPYYEFDSTAELSDADWREKEAGEHAPPLSAWLRELYDS